MFYVFNPTFFLFNLKKMSTTKTLLKAHNLRLTDCREEILRAFQADESAKSHSDLENQFGEQFDRVTIYRTLKTFMDKGLIHKILDDDGGSKYAICRSTCTDQSHNHNHVHFKCSVCHDTTCVESVDIPTFSLPEGYAPEEVNMLVLGVCPKCVWMFVIDNKPSRIE